MIHISPEKLDQAIFKWQARHNRRLTIEELAKKAEIHVQTIYKIKRSTKERPYNARLATVDSLMQVLELESLSDLLARG